MRYRFGDAILDRRSGGLVRAGRSVPLEPRAFHVLCVLIEHAGELVEHHTLIDLVWAGVFVTPHSLTEAISQLRRALDDDSRCPRIIETAHRRGYRFVAPLEQVPDDSSVRWRIPARLVDLIGRDADLAELVSRLGSARLLTLVGPGGVGKTQLALEAARRLEATYADGAQLIDLAPATSQADVLRLVADVLRVPERNDADLAVSIGSILRDTNALLVFDNCERVSEAAGRLAETVLSAAPGMRVLATSQRPLAAIGEALLRLAPLACSGAGHDDSRSPAVRLFAVRAAAVQPGFDASGPQAPVVLQICERLDGLPLAIELAAAQVRVLSPSQILERLDSRFDLLSRTVPAALERHRTLGAVLEWSASLLEPVEMQFLQHVSVFPGGWDLDAAAAVMDRAGNSTAVLTHLTGLVDKSLVLADTSRESARYRLLDSVRLFVLARLVGSGQNPIARDRMLVHYVGLTERADREWYTTSVYQWVERLREERPNLRAAMEWALSAPDRAELGLRLAGNLRWFWRAVGDFTESRSWLSRALAAAPGGVTGVRARAEITLGQLVHHTSDFDTARDMIDRGLRRLSDTSPVDSAWALSLKALNEALSGRLAGCGEAAKAALRIADDLKIDWIAASAGLALGLLHAMRGEHELAVRRMAVAYDLSVSGSDSFLESYVATNLALQRLLVGDAAGSRELFGRALCLSARLHNLRATAGCFEGLAYLAAAAGNARLGARLAGSAARIRDISGAPLLPQWIAAHEAHWQLIESSLGPEMAARERAAGAATPVDDLTTMLLA